MLSINRPLVEKQADTECPAAMMNPEYAPVIR